MIQSNVVPPIFTCIICVGQLFGVTLMATAGALSTYQYKLDQQEQYEQYLKDKEIRERRERGEEL